MASSTALLHHPRHEQHPLKPWDISKHSILPLCNLCYLQMSADGYACQVGCEFYVHRECAEAPPQIDSHPIHPHHPLTLLHRPPPFKDNVCDLCKISPESLFRCDECDFDLDILCALSTLSDREGTQEKSPEQIGLPLHNHTLSSFSTRHNFIGDNSNCVICKESVEGDGYMCSHHWCKFLMHKRCIQELFGDEYDINLDISSTSSTLLDRGGSEGKTPKWIALPLHHHLLTSFSTRYDFVKNSDCVICKESVEGDGNGYACLHWQCEFIIHERCIQDMHFTDGTKAPRVYHEHPLEIFVGEHKGSSRCGNCESEDASGEFFCCASCQLFYCRDCVSLHEIIQYPHHLDHNLVLLMNSIDNYKPECDSCLVSLVGKLCYGCPSCEFFVDMRCALQVLSYCKEGMSAEIELSWHNHPLLLCHRTKSDSQCCIYCEDISAGPMYTCKEEGCKIQLHKRCAEIESTIWNPHHLDHQLNLCHRDGFPSCRACSEKIYYLEFSCELCAFYLHAKCATHVPNRKYPLHEHELLQLEKAPSWKCNRCGTNLSSPFFRCVQCNFNLHEECLKLPLEVVNNEVHWHPLTLHETYIEDDSGEYYCDKCEQKRDNRMGVYVCLHCSAKWAYHIECIIPELRKVCVKEPNAAEIERLARDITKREEDVREAERMLEEMKRELDEQRKKHAELTKR